MSVSPAGETSLVTKATKALGWSVVSTLLNRLSTFAVGVALARILGPDAFGTFAIALVVLLALLSFNELGVSLAIVRWPNEPREIAPTVATLSVASSCVVYVGCYVAAPYVARTMGDPGATAVIRVLALSVIVSGLVATPVALLQREFRQDRKTVADLATNWTSALVSLGGALAGKGAMSLAVGQLAGSVAGAIFFFVFAPSGLKFGFNPAKARALLKFGLPLAGSSIIVFVATNVDRFIVGAVLGPTALGYYLLALNLSNWPVLLFSQPVRAVAPAALARLQHDPPAMRTAFVSAMALLSSITVPACALLAAVSGPLVRFIYGEVWQPASAVLVWLAALALLRILFELVYDFFVVVAYTRAVLLIQLLWLVALVPAVFFGAQQAGLWGAGAAQVLVAIAVVAPVYLLGLGRLGVRTRLLLGQLLMPLGGALVVAAASFVLLQQDLADLVVLAAAGIVALATTAFLGYRLRDVARALRSAESTPSEAPHAPDAAVPVGQSQP